jgi:hypothetical protein
MPPCVGIVWAIAAGNGSPLLVTDLTPLAEAEGYGDFLTHPRGHHEVWEGWRRRGPADLARRGLPAAIAWHEYEHFPRGRVVFDTRAERFTLHADRALQAPAVLHRIRRAFGLDPARCDVRSDPHYCSVRDLWHSATASDVARCDNRSANAKGALEHEPTVSQPPPHAVRRPGLRIRLHGGGEGGSDAASGGRRR